jgi:hypothetical protein
MALIPSRVQDVGKSLWTQMNQRHAPCPPKLNRTAVGLTRQSIPAATLQGEPIEEWMPGSRRCAPVRA